MVACYAAADTAIRRARFCGWSQATASWGWELGYSSDLDLVFLHDCPMEVMTDGEREIDGRQAYLRTGAAHHASFSTRTSSVGILHEVDARLRPSWQRGCWSLPPIPAGIISRMEAWT